MIPRSACYTALVFDLLIANATVYDGNGAPGERGTLAVQDGRIAEVGAHVTGDAREVIDARGRVLCPGFIDVHSHSDFTILVNGGADSKTRQGVTTEVIGNCGYAAAPLHEPCRTHIQHSWAAEPALQLDWREYPEYVERVHATGTAVNLAVLIGHGNLRGSTVGYEQRPATAGERDRMRGLLDDALNAGAFGFSTGLVYSPGCFADSDELQDLGRVAEHHGAVHATHMRSESAEVERALDEVIAISEATGCALQVSHLKCSGPENWHKLDAVLGKIEGARAAGLDVWADRYPYTASSTDLDAVLPAWAFEGGHEAELARLRDPATRRRLRDEILRDHPDDAYWERIVVAGVFGDANKHLEGNTLAEIAADRNEDPCNAMFDLLIEEELRVDSVRFFMDPQNLRRILTRPYVMIGSDASAKAAHGPLFRGKPHPRTYGTCARVLREFVDDGTLSLAEGIHKMTGLPAQRFGLAQRGRLAPGLAADLVLFDPVTVDDRATYGEPHQYAAGIAHVWVAGVPVVRDGAVTPARPGRVLHRRSG